MLYWDNLLFLSLLVIGTGLFIKNMKGIYLNISLGQEIPQINQKKERWLLVLKVALGRGRMNHKPIVSVLHFLVYIGFFIINIEMIEILIDGIFGTHRFLASIHAVIYRVFTIILEIFALFTTLAVTIFFIRRNFIRIPRLTHSDVKGWAKKDANWILILEFLMMWAFFQMNAADATLQSRNALYPQLGSFPISEFIFGRIFQGVDNQTLIFIERFSWWFHFIGILVFLNYLCYSKHLHIIFAFPNIWYSYKKKQGQLQHMEHITQEIQQIFQPSSEFSSSNNSAKFGAEDVFDLNKIQLLNAYTCVECGRCTEVCPANITGKKLSPRKIMMAIRDRLEDTHKHSPKNKSLSKAPKSLIPHYISPEEIWACTSCMACSEVCPLHIDPLSIITDLRRFMVMEQSNAPHELHKMMSNLETLYNPWQYNPENREDWRNEFETPHASKHNLP